ncbi:MAG: DUF3047 domain-containing protein [Candidatus Rokubacteria bacterium]|nr:DUF3047 domain-containing protein [Candidatus Rokubacteria bacterium]
MKPVALAAAAFLVAPAAAPARAQAPDCIVLEDFTTAKVGEFPADWKPRKDAGKDLYRVVEEKGLRFLRAVVRGSGIQAAKQREWDLDAYPVLAWLWRVNEFPQGADERDSATNDSAVAVYLLVPYSRISGPKAVKYVWSEKVPAGTRLASNVGLTQARVLRSGPAKKGEWVEERVNVRDDYKKYHETDDTPKPAGIAVLTDSDDTKSSAQGDYANFRACRG